MFSFICFQKHGLTSTNVCLECKYCSIMLAYSLIPVLCPDEDMIVWFSASGRIIFLVSEEVKFIWIFAGDHP